MYLCMACMSPHNGMVFSYSREFCACSIAVATGGVCVCVCVCVNVSLSFLILDVTQNCMVFSYSSVFVCVA